MKSNFTFRKRILGVVVLIAGLFCQESAAQHVDNRGCPAQYFRNNGNGQSVTVFADNIAPSSVYYQTALTSGNQGNFTLKWGVPITNPPVIKRSWVTSTSGVSSVNWVFGNNATGSPFNPPGVPLDGDVKYTFYNSNLPTAGVITLELFDPYDGSYVNTCSYPLSSGSSSGGTIVSLAVEPPTSFTYPVPSATVVHGNAGQSAAPSVNAAGGTVRYSKTPQVNGVSIDTSSGIIFWDGNVPAGTHQFTVKASNGIAPDASFDYTLTVAESGVGSGNDGGLESRSLGNAVSERVFNQVTDNKPDGIDYQLTDKLSDATAQLIGGIHNLVPDQQALGNDFTGYITSPNDILSFTNAKEVVSVDYVQQGVNKAVAFITKTNRGVYTHTKPVCDRLKGSELLGVETIQAAGYSFLRYQLKPVSGLTEYAISFSAGYNPSDNRYTLQSEWTTDRYATQETMYNVQLWSADRTVLEMMLLNVLQKLISDMPVQQAGAVKKPLTYITRAGRNKDDQFNLRLHISNQTNATAGILTISGKANEQAGSTINRSYTVTLSPNGSSEANIPLMDMAEAEIRLLVNGVEEDFIYNNDGNWNMYKTASSRVTEFSISNDTLRAGADEYRVFRNVKLEATTPDYITVYRMLNGGGVASDLSGYQFLQFTGSGSGNVRIRLLKRSISKYKEQYEYLLPMEGKNRSYTIPLTHFRSSATSATINLKDIVIVSFTYEAGTTPASISSALSNIRFSKNVTWVKTEPKQLKVFPNPAVADLQLAFESAATETMQLQLVHAGNGQVLLQKAVTAWKGNNLFRMTLPPQAAAGMYILRLQSAGQQFTGKLIKEK